jgi:hypothetical protein
MFDLAVRRLYYYYYYYYYFLSKEPRIGTLLTYSYGLYFA